jgi:hypothetical protein
MVERLAFDPCKLVDALNAEQVRSPLDELERERSALVILLLAARARNRRPRSSYVLEVTDGTPS